MAAKTPRETSVNLVVNLGGLTMKNPVTTASGTSLRVWSTPISSTSPL